MFNRLIQAGLIAFSLLLTTGTASASNKVEEAVRAATAEEAVQLATAEVLDLINAGKEYANDEPERFYREVEALLRPMIDFPRFARNVMGPYYKQADDAQRQRFADSFKWSLVRTYALALTEFGSGEVNVLPPRRAPKNPDRVNVTQEISYEGKAYVVVYKMRRGDAKAWSVQNMIVEGVNIGLNYKSQFAAAMKDPQYEGDLDTVIAAWENVIEAEADAAAATESTSAQITNERTRTAATI